VRLSSGHASLKACHAVVGTASLASPSPARALSGSDPPASAAGAAHKRMVLSSDALNKPQGMSGRNRVCSSADKEVHHIFGMVQIHSMHTFIGVDENLLLGRYLASSEGLAGDHETELTVPECPSRCSRSFSVSRCQMYTRQASLPCTPKFPLLPPIGERTTYLFPPRGFVQTSHTSVPSSVREQ
jgi:hypothetical protein